MIKVISIKVKQLTCDRPTCGYVWQIPIDKPEPQTCQRCKSFNWNKPKQPRAAKPEG